MKEKNVVHVIKNDPTLSVYGEGFLTELPLDRHCDVSFYPKVLTKVFLQYRKDVKFQNAEAAELADVLSIDLVMQCAKAISGY